MKKTFINKFSALTMSLLLLFTVNVYAEEQTIVDIAVGNSDFSILVQALQTADLIGALQCDGPFTVFAPTNAAFEALLNTLNISAADLLAHPQLSEVLLYHVVSGQVLSTDLSDGLTAATLQGESIRVDLSNGVKINSSNVTTADVMAKNGVIHVIDSVLVPTNFTYQEVKEDETLPYTGSSSNYTLIALAIGLVSIVALRIRKAKVN